ncbi:MAG: D-alanyl-D-alanine carboxypeptidase [Clostridia bacterium]|nr:D-alanyl-D-alanine carboxypeptidase [Clostridia bacterium]
MKKLMRMLWMLTALACFLGPIGASLGICGNAQEAPLPDALASVLLYHNESGTVLYEKDSSSGSVPAGPAPRMVAALVFLEHYREDLSKKVTVNRLVTGLATSTMNPGLKGGEQISVYDLLCAMLIANSDDAIYALAFDLYENDADAPALLLEELNRKAGELGMSETAFFNITGNDPKSEEGSVNSSTLSDLLTLALAFQKQQTLLDICAIDDLTLDATNKSGKRRLLTRNYLLSAKRIGGYTYKHATGLATAQGSFSGHHVIATARMDSESFTCIVVGAMGLPDPADPEDKRDPYAAFTDARAFFSYANENFAYKRVLDTTSVLGEIKVLLSDDSDYVTVVPEKSLSAFLPVDADLERDLQLVPELEFTRLTAPVYEGLIAGYVRVLYRGEELGRVRLVTAGSLSMSNSRYYLSTLTKVIKTPLFLSIAGGVCLFLLICVLIGARVQYLRKNRPDDLEFVEESEEELPPSPTEGERLSQRIKRLAGSVLRSVEKSGKGKTGGKKEEKEKLEPRSKAVQEKQDALLEHSAKDEPKKALQQTAKDVALALDDDPKDGEQSILSEQQKSARPKVTGAKRLPGKDEALLRAEEEKKRQMRQGGYVPSGWGGRKDDGEE